MTREEKTGIRVSDYSLFRRKFGSEFLTTDLDFVEYRNDRGIVALIDVTANMKDEFHLMNCKRFIWRRTEFQRMILLNISKALKIKAYFVLHTTDLSIFHVHTLPNIEDFVKMDKNSYTNFIKSL